MNNILKLCEKRAKAWDGAKAFLDSKRTKDGVLSAEDTAIYDKMEANVIALGKEIDRLERQTTIDAEMAKATSNPITNSPTSRGGSEKTGRASSEYKSAFWNAMRGQREVSPEVYNSLRVGSDPDGGYLVPTEFEGQIITALLEENAIRQIAKVITTSGDRKIPVVATKGTATWVDEEGAIPESGDKFDQVSLGAFKLATMIKVSEELLNDSAFDLETYIAQSFGGRMGSREEEGFLIGNGVGKPTGIFADKGGCEIGLTTTAAATITLDEVLDLFYSLKSPYRRNATFVMNDSTVKTIRKLKDSNGQYLWQPSIKAETPDTILGRPLVTSAYAPEIKAGAKSIAFGDFSYYWIADRTGRVFKRLNELYAATGQVGFMCTQRVDGKLILPEAIKVLKQKAS